MKVQKRNEEILNPKGNADTERVIRTIKEDLIWIKEWKSPFQLEEKLKTWIVNITLISPTLR